ncbi:MAG: hypothetical protein E7430_08820 [Ruminococcaceae bacterium]|nr:hypothetical protein [Oscillospiraceae bacterium]
MKRRTAVTLCLAMALIMGICLIGFCTSPKEAYEDTGLKAELYAAAYHNMIEYFDSRGEISNNYVFAVSDLMLDDETYTIFAAEMKNAYGMDVGLTDHHNTPENTYVAEFQIYSVSRPNIIYTRLYGMENERWLRQKYRYSSKSGWVLENIHFD